MQQEEAKMGFQRYNRTNVELKLSPLLLCAYQKICYNRTNVELKCIYKTFHLSRGVL